MSLNDPITDSRPSPASSGSRSIGSRLFVLVAIIAAAVAVLFLALPLLALTERALRSIDSADDLTWSTLRQAMELTLKTTLTSLLLILICGTPLAYILGRKQFRGRKLLDTLVDLPIVLPPAVAGIALLLTFGRRGVLGETMNDYGLGVSFSTAAVVLAQCFVSAPFYIRSAKAGFARIDSEAEEAAQVDGADRLRTIRDITLPMAMPALTAGAVLAWARSVGEFGATILFAGNFVGRTQTMPLAIYSRYESGDLTTALVLSSVLLLLSMGILFLLRMVSREEDEGPAN